MNQAIVIVGIGELGGVFARAFLRSGYPVYPVTRNMNMADEAHRLPDPELVLLAVAENDFQTAMAALPEAWRNCIVLLQNELLPQDWMKFDISRPTVISVWFEKKQGIEYKVLMPSRVYGPKAGLVASALEELGILCKILSSEEDLLYELVLKNVFVLTINIAGMVLAEGTTTETLWTQHNDLARMIANDVIDVQEWLSKTTFQRERLIDGLAEGIEGDPNHKCKGRAAQGRLTRVLDLAQSAGLQLPGIKGIQSQLNL